MSASIVRDTLAAELAKLEPVTSTPFAPFGYGSDLSCTSDLTETMDEVDGFSTLALGQAIVRRLDCPRGALPDDPDYGIDLRAYCNRGTTADEVRALAGQIRTEVEKDDRIESLAVTVTPAADGSSLSISLVVTPVAAELGGFTLTLAATSADVLLEEIR